MQTYIPLWVVKMDTVSMMMSLLISYGKRNKNISCEVSICQSLVSLAATFLIQFTNSLSHVTVELDWIVQCFKSPPTQYRLYGRLVLQVKRPNQQYQSTEGESCKGKQHKNTRENAILLLSTPLTSGTN